MGAGIGCFDEQATPKGAAGDSGAPAAGDHATARPAGPDARQSAPPPEATFVLGGAVTGLHGSGLVLRDAAGGEVSPTRDGTFVFPNKLSKGKAFAVSVKRQPTAPSQVCEVSGATGSMAGGPVASVLVTCSTRELPIGGTVSGLVGTGLTLRLNGEGAIPIGANGSFAFPKALADASAYQATIETQPSQPSQTCTIDRGSGVLSGGAVTDIAVTCVTNTFPVGGTVSGLVGSGLVLQNNGAEDIAVGENGAFTFDTPQRDGTPFSVTVKSNPSQPAQLCTVSGGTGTLSGGAVSSMTVNCSTQTYVIGGTIAGLDGSGLVLQNAAGDDVVVNANGTFAFPTPMADLSTYLVTVKTQPVNKWQTCAVSRGAGQVAAAGVIDVAVNCTTNRYRVRGTVSGLAGTGLRLLNNAGDELTIASDGSFAFAADAPSGSGYFVSVSNQPAELSQTCTVAHASGTLTNADVLDVEVTCSTNRYSIGGTITGLTPGREIVLQNMGLDALTLTADGAFSFATKVESGKSYDASVLHQPSSPNQTCVVTGGTGAVVAGNVESIEVNCTTDQYTVGGTVSGLDGAGLVLRSAGGAELPINGNGAFAFPPQIDGSAYAITVDAQPTAKSQTCVLTEGSGNVSGADATGITVVCTTNTYAVGGAITGLTANGLVLTNNGADDLAPNASGAFAFATPIASGSAYAVQVKTQPEGQVCTVSDGSGTVGGAAISSASVTCVSVYPVGGRSYIWYPDGFVTLQINGGEQITVRGVGEDFLFPTPLVTGSAYSVTVVSTSPSWMYCYLSGRTGTVGATSSSAMFLDCD